MATKIRKERAKEERPRKPKTEDYNGMNAKEKENAIKRKYYNGKGKVYFAIKARMKRYGMEREWFNKKICDTNGRVKWVGGCKTIQDVDKVVYKYLKEVLKVNENMYETLTKRVNTKVDETNEGVEEWEQVFNDYVKSKQIVNEVRNVLDDIIDKVVDE